MELLYSDERRLGYVSNEDMLESDEAIHPAIRRRLSIPVDLEQTSEQPNLVTSLIGPSGKYHLPVLDIDFPARLIPSSTPGHFHLYLDGMDPLSWEEYDDLLRALCAAGVIGSGYLFHSQERKMTCVRRPGVKKIVKETV